MNDSEARPPVALPVWGERGALSAAAADRARVSFALRLALGLAASAAILALALREVPLSEVWASLRAARAEWVALALASIAVNTASKAMRWRLLLGASGHPVRFGAALRVLLIGQMLNTIAPVRLGDVARAVLIGTEGPPRSGALATVALEKVADMLCYALLAVLLAWQMALPAWVSQPARALGLMATAALAVAWWLAARPTAPVAAAAPGSRLGAARARLLRQWALALASLRVLRRRQDGARLWGWSAVVWGSATLTNLLVLQALDIQTPLASGLLLLLVLQAGITLTGVPATLGIWETICVVVLALFGVGRAEALGYGVLLHALVLVPTTLAGLFLFSATGLTLSQIMGRRRPPW